MKKMLFATLIAAGLRLTVQAQQADPYIGIIPAPVSVQKQSGVFVFSNSTTIVADNTNDKAVQFFMHYLQQHDHHNTISTNAAKNTTVIVLTSKGTDNLPAEGYKLTIAPKQITINGKGAGLFYGIQTLIQLLPVSNQQQAALPCAAIEDYPRFPYRGMHLDVVRHFYPVSFVKEYIDLLAAYKLNTFHWHLTDDQGWRIEIKKYPRLTQVGCCVPKTYEALYNNIVNDGYYTQAQIKEVVDYAAARYITIVPEIEMPGHSQAAVAAYPVMGCSTDSVYAVGDGWRWYWGVFCPRDTTFAILQDVLTEVMQLFPGKYIHIGGDECPKEPWKNSAFCQELIKREGLKDEEGLQSYFIRRIERFVNSKGHSIIGWDEILEGGLSPNATVMSWRGEQGGIAAAQQNHDVIMTPASKGLYFDHLQSKSAQEPKSIGGFAPYTKTYAYDPAPASLTPEQQKHVIGVQGNMWTEYIATPAKVEYMLLPRLLSLSEIAWTPVAKKDAKDFETVRTPHQLARLDTTGYNYRVPVAIGASDTTVTIKGSVFDIALQPSVEGATIYYTLNGFVPSTLDLPFKGPMHIEVPAGKKAELQTIVITPAGKRSIVATTVLDNTTL